MLDMKKIVEEMRANGFEVTVEDVAEVHQGMEDGRADTGTNRKVYPEIARQLQLQSEQAMGDGQVENAGF